MSTNQFPFHFQQYYFEQDKKDMFLFWHSFLDSVRSTKNEVNQFVNLLHSNPTNDKYGFWKSLFGIDISFLDEEQKEDFIKFYLEYTTWRGTIKGLKILLNIVLPNSRCRLIQGPAPMSAYILGESRLNSTRRILNNESDFDSLVIELDERLDDSTRLGLRHLLKKEIPSHVKLYITNRDVRSNICKNEGIILDNIEFGEVLDYVDW